MPLCNRVLKKLLQTNDFIAQNTMLLLLLRPLVAPHMVSMAIMLRVARSCLQQSSKQG